MLILTRRVGESLMIGDEISVTVLGVKGNQVRLGVNAPKTVATQASLIKKGRNYVVSASGGVQVYPWELVQESAVSEAVASVRAAATLSDSWWWD